MRIIAGKFKGRPLAAPKGRTVRPTSTRVKESVFSILREWLIDANFLDLCAGTGSLGIEALSRGAKHVTFVEAARRCTRIIERNLQGCGLSVQHSQVKLLHCDIEKVLSYPPKWELPATGFELIYFDPPYHAGLYAGCLDGLAASALLHASGRLAVEHSKRCSLPATVGILTKYRREHYGDTALSFYHVA